MSRSGLFFIFLLAFLNLQSRSLPDNYEFVRLTETHFQTRAWVLSSDTSPALILLLGTIHLGEENYYYTILDLLLACDVVFYEDIQSRSKKSSLPSVFYTHSKNLVLEGDLGITTGLQMEYAKALDLIHQGQILYPRKNWVNADMSMEDFQKEWKEFLKQNLSLDKKSLDGNITEARDILQDKEKDPWMVMVHRKRIAQESSKQAIQFYTDANYSHLYELFIRKRNQVAMEKISPYLEEPILVGMVYGAAHAPDFLERLEQSLNYKITSDLWIDAWSFQ